MWIWSSLQEASARSRVRQLALLHRRCSALALGSRLGLGGRLLWSTRWASLDDGSLLNRLLCQVLVDGQPEFGRGARSESREPIGAARSELFVKRARRHPESRSRLAFRNSSLKRAPSPD